jgi:hypothetical protein
MLIKYLVIIRFYDSEPMPFIGEAVAGAGAFQLAYNKLTTEQKGNVSGFEAIELFEDISKF